MTPPPQTLPRGLTRTPHGGYRVRVSRAGQIHILPLIHDYEEARTALAKLLETLGPPQPPRKPRLATRAERDADHRRQVDALPGRNVTRNIYREASGGYRVGLRRDNVFVYGGHYTGPKALKQAVKCRDELEDLYPRVRG